MGYQVYEVGSRYGGYGVLAYCEYPGCAEEIDRGMPYACGGEPFSEHGCDLYFCGKHLEFVTFDNKGERYDCEHIGECECEMVELCERCRAGQEPFLYKPEHPKWVKYLLTDESWDEWRKDNPEEVKNLKKHGRHKI